MHNYNIFIMHWSNCLFKLFLVCLGAVVGAEVCRNRNRLLVNAILLSEAIGMENKGESWFFVSHTMMRVGATNECDPKTSLPNNNTVIQWKELEAVSVKNYKKVR